MSEAILYPGLVFFLCLSCVCHVSFCGFSGCPEIGEEPDQPTHITFPKVPFDKKDDNFRSFLVSAMEVATLGSKHQPC